MSLPAAILNILQLVLDALHVAWNGQRCGHTEETYESLYGQAAQLAALRLAHAHCQVGVEAETRTNE